MSGKNTITDNILHFVYLSARIPRYMAMHLGYPTTDIKYTIDRISMENISKKEFLSIK